MRVPPSHSEDFARRFESAFARLQVAVLDASAREAQWPAQVATAIRVALRFGAADPAAARALTVDALARGAEDARRRHRAIEYFAELLGATVPEDAQRSEMAEQLLVGAIFSLAADRIYAGDAEGLPGLAADLIHLTLLPYVGAEEASRLAEAPA